MERGTAPKGTAARRSILWLARIALSAIILFLLFRFAPAGDVWSRMRSISPLLWISVFALFLAGHVASAFKWRLLIGRGISVPDALRAHFAGLAANLMLPGVAGGDIVRAGLVMRHSDRKATLAIGSLADRIIDTGTLVIISAFGAWLIGARAGISPLALAFAAGLVFIVGVISIVTLPALSRSLSRMSSNGRAGALILKVAGALSELSQRRTAFFVAAIISIVVQAGFAMMNGLIAINLGAETPIAVWLFAWPLAKLVATLPISFGGIGVREATLAGIVSPLGYASAGVIAASLIWQTIQFSAGALGAFMQLAARRKQMRPAHG